MPGKFEIKATVTGAQQGADEIKKLGDASIQAGQKIEKSGEQAQKAASKKNDLLDAAKKLKAAIPGVGFAVDALKNPFTVLAAAVGLALNQFRQFKEQVEALEQIIGRGTIADQLNNIRTAMASAAVDAAKFKAALAEINNRPETVAEGVARRGDAIERNLKVEAARDEMAKDAELAANPEAKDAIEEKFRARARQREQRKLGGNANNLAQAQFRAEDIVREGVAALPEAQQRLAAAQIKRDELLAIADSNTIDLGALEKQRAGMAAPGVLGRVGDFFNPAGRKRRLGAIDDAIEIARARNASAATLRVQANAGFDIAQQNFSELQARTLGAAEEARKFATARTGAVADAAAMQPFNDPAGARFGADSRAAQAAFENFLRTIILITNDGQKKVDAISRASASQSQQ